MRTRTVWVATQYSKKGTIHFNVQPSKSGRTMRRGTFCDRCGHTANRLPYSFPRAAESCSCKSLIFALADPSAQQCRLNSKARKKSLYRLTSFSPLVGKKFPLVGTIVSTCRSTKNTPQINLMLGMQSTLSMAKR